MDGREIGSLPPWKRRIGYVFQEAHLFPHLSVGSNIAYGPFIRGMRRKERNERVDWALSLVHMERFRDRRPDSLSGGERQRISIARALAADPAALFLDEPFSSLDAPLRREMQEAFCELKTRLDLPAIFVTHDREEAAAVGERIAIMEGGRIVEEGRIEELFADPTTSFSARFLGLGSLVSSLERDPGSKEEGVYTDSPPRDTKEAILIPRHAVSLQRKKRPPREGEALLEGEVRRLRFEADAWLVELDARLSSLLAVRVDARQFSKESAEEGLLRPGQRVYLYVDLAATKTLKA